MLILSDGKTSWKYELSIDVNSMTLLLEPTRRICAAGYRSGTLRRLTTPPRSTNPNHPHSTKWKWYWEDNGAVWCMYEKDHLVNCTFICIMSHVDFIRVSLECFRNLRESKLYISVFFLFPTSVPLIVIEVSLKCV